MATTFIQGTAPIAIVANSGTAINFADYLSLNFSGGNYAGYWLYSDDRVNDTRGYWGTAHTDSSYSIGGTVQPDGFHFFSQTEISNVQITAGNEIHTDMLVQVHTGDGPAVGDQTWTNFWIRIIPNVYHDLTPSVINGSDVVAAARAFYTQFAGIASPDGCHDIASTFAAAAGAPLPTNSGSTNPSENEDGGLWSVVYRGNEVHDTNWQSRLQPGDIVRLHWAAGVTGDFHTFTVLSVSGNLVETIDNTGGTGTLNLHSVNFQNRADPETITIYRITRDHNLLQGTTANDLLYGSVLNDDIRGGSGNDDLRGGTGDDILAGGTGNDTVFGGIGADFILGNQDSDFLLGNQDNDLVVGGQGSDTLVGGQGNDFLFGNEANDLLFGNENNDTIIGGQGDDTVLGGQGDDLIFGNEGNDLLYGNEGNNVFVFGSGSGADRIANFTSGGDHLDLQGQTYSLSELNGDALLTLSGGGTIELLGITRQNFAPSFVS